MINVKIGIKYALLTGIMIATSAPSWAVDLSLLQLSPKKYHDALIAANIITNVQLQKILQTQPLSAFS